MAEELSGLVGEINALRAARGRRRHTSPISPPFRAPPTLLSLGSPQAPPAALRGLACLAGSDRRPLSLFGGPGAAHLDLSSLVVSPGAQASTGWGVGGAGEPAQDVAVPQQIVTERSAGAPVGLAINDPRLAEFEGEGESSVRWDGRAVAQWAAGNDAVVSTSARCTGTLVERARRLKKMCRDLRWEVVSNREATAAQFDEFEAELRAMQWRFQEALSDFEDKARTAGSDKRFFLSEGGRPSGASANSEIGASTPVQKQHCRETPKGLRICFHVFQGGGRLHGVRRLDGKSVEVDYRNGKRVFTCDAVLAGTGSLPESQEEVGRIARGVLKGEGGCILAFGSKSSGHLLALFGVPAGSKSPNSPSYRSHARGRGIAQEAVDIMFSAMKGRSAEYCISATVASIDRGGDGPVDVMRETSGLGRRVFQGLLEDGFTSSGHSGTPISDYQDFDALCRAASLFCDNSFLLERADSMTCATEHLVITLVARNVRTRKEAKLRIAIASADSISPHSGTKAYGFADIAAARARGEVYVPYRLCPLTRALPTFFDPDSNSLALICVSQLERTETRISTMIVGKALVQGCTREAREGKKRATKSRTAGRTYSLKPMPRAVFHF